VSAAAVEGGGLPVAVAVRRPPRTLLDPPTWRVRCPFCTRPHLHTADVRLKEMVLPARCGRGERFYLLREVEGDPKS
jgi:hypothetical protein